VLQGLINNLLSLKRDFYVFNWVVINGLMIRKLAILLASTVPTMLSAQAVPNSIDEVVELRLLPGWRGEDGVHVAALQFSLAPGWKTYWRAPGDGGVPTQVIWSTSDNVDDAEIHWPLPEVFRDFGQRSIGYRDEVVLPIKVTPKTAEDITLRTTVRFGVCDEICLPVMLDLTTVLPASQTTGTEPIELALNSRAIPAAEAGVHSVACELNKTSDGYSISVSMSAPEPDATEALVIEASDPLVWISEPVLTRDGTALRAEAAVSAHVDASDLRLTLIDQLSAIDIQGCN